MSELVVVYKALPDEAQKIVELLESSNLNPVVIDDVEKMGAYRNHEIRIAVPQTERDIAAGILAETDRQNQTSLIQTIKISNTIVFIIAASLGIIAIIGILDTESRWFIASWLLLTAVVAAALIRWAWFKKSNS
jgi:hypothetical protein